MVCNLHAGGYGSEDSDAYIPMVKSALQSRASSAGADHTAKHAERAVHESDCAHSPVKGSSQPQRERSDHSGPARSDSADEVAHQSTNADGHADGKIVDNQACPLHTDNRQQPVDESVDLQSSPRDELGAAPGAGGKKRKYKAKKGKSRSSKRQAQDGKAEDQNIESPEVETVKARCNEQDLDDLRVAALRWASKAQQDPDGMPWDLAMT